MTIRHKDSQKQVFRTRYSLILVVVMAVSFGVLIYAALIEPGWFVKIACLLGMGLIALCCGFTYVINGDRLIMKNWSWKIGEVNIHAIAKVRRSYLALSSNAWSLKRLEIRLQKGSKYPFLLISPVREREFLEMLTRVNSKIQIDVSDRKGRWRIWDIDI